MRIANHDKVEAFCKSHGVLRTARTPNSFSYCPFDVIERAWTKLNELGMSALLATKLWYSVDEVDEFMEGLNVLAKLLTPAQLAAASCNGLWHLMNDGGGADIVTEWYKRLTAAQFATTSCDGFWSLLSTADGRAVADEWYKHLKVEGFCGDDALSAGVPFSINRTLDTTDFVGWDDCYTDCTPQPW